MRELENISSKNEHTIDLVSLAGPLAAPVRHVPVAVLSCAETKSLPAEDTVESARPR